MRDLVMNAHSKNIEPSRRDLVVGATLVGGALMVGCSPADLLSAGAVMLLPDVSLRVLRRREAAVPCAAAIARKP